MTAGSQPEIVVTGLAPGLAEVVAQRAGQAAGRLELVGRLVSLHVCADDDLPVQDSAWYRLHRRREDGKGALTLFCSCECFLRPRSADSTIFPRREVWERRPAPPAEAGPGAAAFSPERTDMFLHHHLLTVRDMIEGKLAGDEIPPCWSEAMTAAWAVCVDGRLDRLGLPGYPLAERRGTFSRLFSSAGVLMPDHWQVFHSLWEGGLVTQQDVLGAVRLLPRL